MRWETDDQDRDVERNTIDAMSAVVGGTEYAPPEGAVLIEAVVVMGWFLPDGSHATTYVRAGTPWGTHGLLVEAIDQVDNANSVALIYETDDEDDE